MLEFLSHRHGSYSNLFWIYILLTDWSIALFCVLFPPLIRSIRPLTRKLPNMLASVFMYGLAAHFLITPIASYLFYTPARIATDLTLVVICTVVYSRIRSLQSGE